MNDQVLAAYDALVARIPGLERKGVTLPYTSINGNMSSFVTPDGTVALRRLRRIVPNSGRHFGRSRSFSTAPS